jgi:hypothetical protein
LSSINKKGGDKPMTGRTTNYYVTVNGKKEYTHASTKKQAASTLGAKLGVFILPDQVREVKPLYVYTFYRKTSEFEKAAYEACLAKSDKQARFFFLSKRGTKNWDAHIDSIRAATKEDRKRIQPGEFIDVTW